MPKNAPKVRDAEVTRAFEHTYKDINELIMSVNGLSSKSNREGYKGKNGDMRLYRDLRTKQYFFEGRFDDGWAQVELDLAKKTNTTTVTTSGDSNVQSDWNVSDNTSDAFIKNKPNVQYTSAIPSMGSGNSYAAGLTPAGSGTHSDTYLRKDGTWATPINTTYSVMASGNSYAAGLVPAGSGTHNNTFLRKDGTWVAPSSGIALTDLSASAPITYDNSSGAFSIADHAVALAKLPEIASARFLGRTSSSTGDVEVLTVGQVGTLLSLDQYLTAPRTVTAGGNTLASSETLAFVAGSNVTISESGGSVTIASTDTNTDTVDMGDGFRLVDVDSNVQVTENKYVKFKTASGGSGFGDITGGDGSSGNPWIYQLQYTDTNTTYSVMGSGNSYAAGLVLAGASSHGNTYLRKDGTWDLPSIHIQDADGDSLTVDIDEHIKITGTGGISTDWTTDDAGGSGAPNILTIGLGSITQVGALSQGSIASGFTTIDEGFIDADIVRKNANTTITGIYTFSGKGIAINAGTANDASGYDASLYISASQDNDWGIWIDKTTLNYGIKVDVAADASSAFGVYNDSTNRFMITGAGVVTWNGGGSANANTAYSWGDHGSEGYLKNITGQSISNLNDVNSISGISNGQVLVWNSTASAFQPGSSSYSWYLKDGDTTSVQVTSGKYVKLVEGTGIDIDFTDTDSGAVDDEFDVTITNTLMSGGTIGGNLTVSPGAIGINMNPASSPSVLDIGGNTAVSRIWNGSSTFVGGVGTDSWAHSGNTTDLTVYAQAQLHISANGSKRMLVNSSYVMSYMDLYVNKSSPYIQFGNGGNTNSAAIRLGGDNGAGGRLYFQYNGDSSYIDVYGGHGSTERYRDLYMYARSFTFRTAAATTLGTAFTIDSSQNVFANNIKIGSTHLLESVSQGNMRITGTNSAAVGINLYAGGNHRGWIYSNDSSEIGFLDTSGSWDLRKTMNSHLLVYGSGSTIAKFGSGDAWGRIEFEGGFTNGIYVYTQHGDFKVDGGHWNPYGNADTNLGSDSLRWNNIWINSVAQVGQLKLNNNFKWEQGSSAYGRFSDWLQGGGSHGIYWPNTGMTSSPHFYPVGTGYSYGTFLVSNGQSSWHGMALSGHSSKPTYMHDSSHGGGGLYYQTTPRWAMYWDVGNDCMAIGASTNSSSYWLYVHGAIYSTGDVVAFSDARVKTNVVTIDNPLDKVLNMRGVYYNPIDKETKEVDDRRRVGVIAQELNEVLPEAVTYAEDVDEYGVDYGKLTGVLIEAIKELKQEINELKGS